MATTTIHPQDKASRITNTSSGHVFTLQNQQPSCSPGSKAMLPTLFQRLFTKPATPPRHDAEKTSDLKATQPVVRKLALTAPGSIVAGIIMLLILAAVVGAAVAVTNDHHKRPVWNLVPSSSTGATILSPGSPIRSAIPANFADPMIWKANGTWYAYATGGRVGVLDGRGSDSTNGNYSDANVQFATSSDFITWDLLSPAQEPLPTTGLWALQGDSDVGSPHPNANVWAPAIIQRSSDSKYIMYYSAIFHNTTSPDGHQHPVSHCVGAAVSESDSPAGPFLPLPEALACPLSRGGAIDPYGFQDNDGTLYVAWKVDGNNIGHGGECGNTVAPIVSTPIMLQKMAADGITPVGEPVQILDRTAADGPLIEAPALIRSKKDGTYFLFFSSGCTRNPDYNVKYATAPHITGPYTRATTPLLVTGDWGLEAPGSVGVHMASSSSDHHDDDDEAIYLAFHARVTTTQGRVRAMFTSGLELNGTSAKLAPAKSS